MGTFLLLDLGVPIRIPSTRRTWTQTSHVCRTDERTPVSTWDTVVASMAQSAGSHASFVALEAFSTVQTLAVELALAISAVSVNTSSIDAAGVTIPVLVGLL